MLSNYLKKLHLPATQRLTSVQLRCISEHTKKSIFGRKPIKEKEELSQEGEKVTPFFGTGFEQAHYIRIKERAKHMDEVHEKEGVLNEERKENSEEFEGFENEGDVDEKDFTKRRSSSGVYS
jgi:hypothetical protein